MSREFGGVWRWSAETPSRAFLSRCGCVQRGEKRKKARQIAWIVGVESENRDKKEPLGRILTAQVSLHQVYAHPRVIPNPTQHFRIVRIVRMHTRGKTRQQRTQGVSRSETGDGAFSGGKANKMPCKALSFRFCCHRIVLVFV